MEMRRYLRAFLVVLRLMVAIILTGFVAGPSMASPANLKPGDRPAGVPADYEVTPFGYFPPECIQQIHRGDKVTEDGAIQRVNGDVERHVICARDNFTHDGVRVRADGMTVEGNLARAPNREGHAGIQAFPPPAISHQWLTDGSYISDGQIGRIVASWTVPANPQTRSNQTIYFFPGMQADTVLQPVLGYRGASNTWDLSSWNCCKDGNAQLSDYISAKPGDKIVGDTYSTCAAGVTCKRWNIDTKNMTSGQGVRLTTVPYGEDLFEIIGGALEAYSVSSCDEFPSGGSLTFSNIAVYDRNMNRLPSPPWSGDGPDDPDQTPQCNYHTSTSDSSVTVHYR